MATSQRAQAALREQLRRSLSEISVLLGGKFCRTSNQPDPFRAIIFVEDIGMFVSRDWAYGIVDLDIQALEEKYPGKVVYKIGVAENLKG